ncbi:MAG: hypothetical protein E6248_05025 [Clostridium sp.]|uniref:DUF7922 domain-containing protein n=1 Tax=Clostridium sp. TaxID=1506 RepID=UPI00290DA624|nr:hypothetical protein [Clostridium sp.]MDU5109784.1 hypothetical protein [Clostridium sp.]
MSQLNKLYRNFIILQEDERGYSSSNDKTLSGYSKIEAKGETCKISFYAQNLRHDEDEDYYILAICNKKDAKKIVNLGKLLVSEGGKAEVTKEYSIDNIGGLGISYDKISGAAIAKMKNEIPIVIMCGFINGEQPSDSWKNYKVVKAAHDKGKHKHDDKKKDDKKKDDKKKCDKHREDEARDVIIQEVTGIFKEEDLEPIEDYDEEIREEIELIQEEDENRSDASQEDNIEEKLIQEDPIREEVLQDEDIQKNEIRKNPFENNNIDKNPFDNNEENLSRGYIRNKFDEYEETIEDKEEFEVRGSVGEYFEGLANGFECCRGKYDEIKYCKWYKVPVSDLHEMCNMSNYNRYAVAYYPMLNYYPYIRQHRYFMLGYKCDKEGNLRYIVYGIPGKRNIDDQPYEGKTGFVTWVSDESRDGSGCWLMFYDFKNSTVVVPME